MNNLFPANLFPVKIIQTKYIPWTTTRPTRIKAFDSLGNQVTLCKDSLEGDDFEQYKSAAKKLMEKMDWHGILIGGGTGEGYAFAIVN